MAPSLKKSGNGILSNYARSTGPPTRVSGGGHAAARALARNSRRGSTEPPGFAWYGVPKLAWNSTPEASTAAQQPAVLWLSPSLRGIAQPLNNS